MRGIDINHFVSHRCALPGLVSETSCSRDWWVPRPRCKLSHRPVATVPRSCIGSIARSVFDPVPTTAVTTPRNCCCCCENTVQGNSCLALRAEPRPARSESTMDSCVVAVQCMVAMHLAQCTPPPLPWQPAEQLACLRRDRQSTDTDR